MREVTGIGNTSGPKCVFAILMTEGEIKLLGCAIYPNGLTKMSGEESDVHLVIATGEGLIHRLA